MSKIDFGELFECKVCDTPTVAENGYHSIGLCATCVRQAANEYCKKHGGEPDWRFCSDAEWKAFESSKKKDKRSKIPISVRTEVYERDAYRCSICGAHKELCVDHIHPISKGGTDDIINLQTLCRPCNSRKGDSVNE